MTKREILETALDSFESGHLFEENDFDSTDEYLQYCDYIECGPVGFYEEFKDELEFSEDYIFEYGYEV